MTSGSQTGAQAPGPQAFGPRWRDRLPLVVAGVVVAVLAAVGCLACSLIVTQQKREPLPVPVIPRSPTSSPQPGQPGSGSPGGSSGGPLSGAASTVDSPRRDRRPVTG